jgi:uncharacterized protein YgbK (DUF1537 family)
VPAPSAPFPSLCIVADDLSGAADCAASFAAVAGPVPVVLDGAAAGDCIAVDTDSRAMGERDAVAAVTRVFATVRGRPQLVYKKIDSTLRGHVGAELAVALRAGDFAGAVVAPAFPDQGRTLDGGRLLVHGRVPDLGHSNDLMAMLDGAGLRPALLAPALEDAALLARRIEALLQQGARAVVVDAARQQDLAMLAAALREVRAKVLVAGSAGLARALAAHVRPGASGAVAAGAAQAGGLLTVVGSFSAAAQAQAQQSERAGSAQVIRLGAPQWLDEQHAKLRRDGVDEARLALASGRSVLFAIAGAVVQPFTRSLVVAMARSVAPLVQQAGACVLTGGDTAHAVFAELGMRRLDVSGEFEPGISIGHAPAQPGRPFILKAGGFGDELALQRVIQHFGRASA